ncbi:cytochrome c oxidase assembly protein [Streptomyces sp. AM 2-1-1]|uniref:cytochrome c oxidase assembly protein n=1 Tax=Streptomyces sp. AM 2-1-1 TaxID=3028709 RepID=UPI0023B93E10|nr:cytochrome c oxidase assembly protein [Streptomyces sp. AM 2-1-1]WEH42040.1 cytochrome c oxidase assembly protein [Streptomyces sp. AM 2-1-1]
MEGMHHPGDTDGPPGALSGAVPVALALLVLLALATGYLLAVRRTRRRNPARGWSPWRSASFLAGLALLAVALLPPLGPAAHHDFSGHMAQHMLVGMYAPAALVLAAPVTLLLRTVPPAAGRRVTAVLHTWPAEVVTHPAVALLLSTGTLAFLYFTPLYGAAMAHPAGHWLMLTHFLASGYLFAHAVAGPDPAPSRPGVRTRLVYLGIAVASHALISQALYGGFFVDVPAPVDQVQRGAEIMYYGGDIAELLLAGALVATWRPERRTRPAARAGHRERETAGA